MTKRKIDHVDPNRLKPASYKPRQIGDEALDRLKRGIEELGLVDAIIDGGDGVVDGGHERLRVAQGRGMRSGWSATAGIGRSAASGWNAPMRPAQKRDTPTTGVVISPWMRKWTKARRTTKMAATNALHSRMVCVKLPVRETNMASTTS